MMTTWRRPLVVALAVVLLGALMALVPGGTPAGAAVPPPPPAPTPTPPLGNGPTNIYAIGDSITTATGTGNLGAETPANSWVTGTNGSVNSMRARLGLPTSAAVNLASNGRRMQDFDNQANQLPASARYVVVELGGNDLCRPSVPEMTSVAAYRQELRNGLAAVRANAPDALIFVASIPDIYNLWYIRGAEQPYNPNPSPRRSGLAGAHTYWDFPLIDVIPCQSLVDSPTDSSPGATARRLAVRQRNLELNQVLAEECGAVVRCRFDDGNLFELSSNRVDPYANVEPGPNGYLPFGQRQFTDDDISYNFGTWSFLCPAPGVISGGTVCGDHFHPSLQGQAKLAESGHETSFQFGDDTFPDPSLAPDRAPDGGGAYAGPVGVDVSATDDVGVRGFEYRIHHPDGSIGPWTEHIGGSFSVPVTELGTTHVEARAFDVNGNRSASEHTTVLIDPDAFGSIEGTVLEEGTGDPLPGVTVELHGAGSEGVIASTTTDGFGAYVFAGLVAGEQQKLHVVDGDGSHASEWAQNATGHGDGDTYTVPGGAAEEVTVRLEAVPTELSVTKHADLDAVVAGDDLGWTVTIENAADRTLTNIIVDDPVAEGCEEQEVPDLAAGESYEIECSSPTLAGFAERIDNVVTVDAAEVPEPVEATDHGYACTEDFGDVPAAHPFFTDVCWLVGEGITTGYEDGTFKPANAVSRQAMAAFLQRLAGATDAVAPGTATFSDVPTDHPFFGAIEWAVAEGIIGGYGDGTFKPANPVSRQAMAAFLFRMVRPDVDPPEDASFSDVPTDHPFFAEIEWLASTGVTTGYEDGTFKPASPVSRQAMAAFLHRFSDVEGAPIA